MPGYEVATFNGIVAPAANAAPRHRAARQTINEGLQAPENKTAITHPEAISDPGSPEGFSAFIAAQHRQMVAGGEVGAYQHRLKGAAQNGNRRRSWPK